MRNLKLTVAYDGAPFHGWQVQPGVPTIQGALQAVFRRILSTEVIIHGSGRTDAGVHALAQTAHVHLEHPILPHSLLAGANALLPPEIRLLAVEEVAAGFHARRSAVAKTYQYHLWRGGVVPPFRHRYVHANRQALDLEKMNQAAARLVGRHDFTSFSAAATEIPDRVRTIYDAEWTAAPPEWIFRVRADGFLRYMVRTIVGTLLEVGRGRIEPDGVDGILAAKDRGAAGPSAPAGGLHLVSVEYASSGDAADGVVR